ncbi:MAG: hypothetical protein LQ343_006551 [Gyalolechia ehrenbergii]|nr:MAG: hypothetical protein LQ343_006551 [Gyalolechia ehrenbergii]
MRPRSLYSFLVPLTLILLPCIAAEPDIFPSDHATCVNNSAELNDVTVQPYCDNAISTVCNVAQALAGSFNLRNYKAVGIPPLSGRGACEVNILFFEPRPAFQFNYSTCVEAFQSITIDCMLIGYGKHAGKGHQSGVRGVLYNPEGKDNSSTNPMFSALEAANPGYIVGPPGAYGEIYALDLTRHVPGNVVKPKM